MCLYAYAVLVSMSENVTIVESVFQRRPLLGLGMRRLHPGILYLDCLHCGAENPRQRVHCIRCGKDLKK